MSAALERVAERLGPRARRHVPLGPLTTYRVGGPAELFVTVEDDEALAAVAAAVRAERVPTLVVGRGSNLLVADAGFRGVAVQLAGVFEAVAIDGPTVTAGGAASLPVVARQTAAAGLTGFEWAVGVPGSIGGAVRMNAGCYGAYIADVLVSARAVLRSGEIVTLAPADLDLRYRRSRLPEGAVLIEATLEGPPAAPEVLHARMEAQLRARDASQPTGARSAGSTFRNPAGFSSTGRADDTHDLKAWKVIEEAGMRGARRGGAQISEKHANFLINTGTASAADLEGLGEEVRKKVYDSSGITLEWEIMRVGDPQDHGKP